MLVLLCSECKGKGEVLTFTFCDEGDEGYFEDCKACGGDGFTPPSQDVLDELECMEIERNLIAGGYLGKPDDEWEIRLTVPDTGVKVTFIAPTKLEAYRKAGQWVDSEIRGGK